MSASTPVVPPHPWTVMIKYVKTGRTFFVTEIDTDTEVEAVAVVLSLGYCLPRDAFELSAKRVPILPKEMDTHAPDNHTVQPHASEKTAPHTGIRASATRK